jgi:hypothetical protein
MVDLRCIFILFLKEIFNMEVFFFFSCLKTYSELILSIYSLTYSELSIYSLTFSKLSIYGLTYSELSIYGLTYSDVYMY